MFFIIFRYNPLSLCLTSTYIYILCFTPGQYRLGMQDSRSGEPREAYSPGEPPSNSLYIYIWSGFVCLHLNEDIN